MFPPPKKLKQKKSLIIPTVNNETHYEMNNYENFDSSF